MCSNEHCWLRNSVIHNGRDGGARAPGFLLGIRTEGSSCSENMWIKIQLWHTKTLTLCFFFQIKSTINQEPLRFLRELSGQQIKGEMLRNDVSVTIKTLSLVCVWKTLDGWHEAWPDNSRVNGS